MCGDQKFFSVLTLFLSLWHRLLYLIVFMFPRLMPLVFIIVLYASHDMWTNWPLSDIAQSNLIFFPLTA